MLVDRVFDIIIVFIRFNISLYITDRVFLKDSLTDDEKYHGCLRFQLSYI